MKAKNIDLFKLAELIDEINPLADVTSIDLDNSDYKINFSLGYSDLQDSNRDKALNELHQILNKYGV